MFCDFPAPSRFHLTVLEFLVLLCQLFRHGVEALTDMWLVFVGGILYHIVTILLQNGSVDLANLIHVFGAEESIDRVWQSSDSNIKVQYIR